MVAARACALMMMLEKNSPSHRSKQCTLGAQSYKWYGMDAQDVLIVKIPIIRKLYWPLLRY